MFVVAAGSLYESTDAGVSWSALTSPFTARLQDIAFAGSTLYVESVGYQLAVSNDFGGSFAIVGNLPGSRLAVSAVTSATVFTWTQGEYDEVSRSDDSGVTWYTVLSGPTILDVAVAATDSGTIAVATNGGGFLVTHDGGTTWSEPLAGNYASAAIDPVDSSTIYAGTGGVQKSTDGGVTWSNGYGYAEGWPIGDNARVLRIAPSAPSFIFAGLEVEGMASSLNGASSWQLADAGISVAWTYGVAVDAVNPLLVYAIVNDYRDPGTPLYVTTTGGQ